MLNNSDRDEDDFDTWYKIIKKLGCVYTLDDTGSDIEALDVISKFSCNIFKKNNI